MPLLQLPQRLQEIRAGFRRPSRQVFVHQNLERCDSRDRRVPVSRESRGAEGRPRSIPARGVKNRIGGT